MFKNTRVIGFIIFTDFVLACDNYFFLRAYDYEIPAHGKVLIKTDLQIELPVGCYGRVAPRSGLSWKHHLDIAAGVIDEDYRGNVGVVVFNHADEAYSVKRGDRIAQLICEKIFYPEVEEVQIRENLKTCCLTSSIISSFFSGVAKIPTSDLNFLACFIIQIETWNSSAVFSILQELGDTERGKGGFGSTGYNEKVIPKSE
ncbi:deoxyuridine triphosphatase isoform X2 [Lycorma delicatula]|uniref:deoxyuridine triphosphatase isoform X2 n=1 Tax=Lycorma delicatula TaxID=130591 RepID=UPI003F51683E